MGVPRTIQMYALETALTGLKREIPIMQEKKPITVPIKIAIREISTVICKPSNSNGEASIIVLGKSNRHQLVSD
jgi:hypothetical protein